MDRASALRILGLDASASPSEVEAAYWALRGHIEVRAEESHSELFRAERAGELRLLDEAIRTVRAYPNAGAGSAGPGRSRALPWLWAWASLSTLLALVLAVLLLVGPSEPPPGSVGAGGGAGIRGDTPVQAVAPAAQPGAGEAPTEAITADTAPGAQALLIAQATLEDTQLEILDESGSQVVRAPADGRSHALAPGSYRLRATNPACPDEWVEEVTLEAGERHEVLASNCADTGWVVVRSNVGGDRVMVDGRSAGSTGPHQHTLSAGEHTVRVTKPGYQPWDGVIVVEAAELVTLRAQLVPSEEEPESPSDDAEPPGADAAASAAADAEIPERDPSMLIASRGWHDSARQWLLARYDLNLSRQLDTPQEIEAIPCTEWLGLERSFDASGLGLPLTRLYGFDGPGWVESSLGVSTRMRDVAYLHMRRCGLR